MLRSVRIGLLASTVLMGMAAGALAQGLVTADHVGKADAPNTLTMRLNPDQSPNSPVKEIGAQVRRRLGEVGRGASRTGRSSSSSSARTSAPSTRACSSRPAPAARPTA